MIRCLYVDDETNLLAVSKEFLELTGTIHLVTCDSPKKALEICKEFVFDVIISDYEMPEMNGIELFDALRKDLVETPFILFTGRGREEVAIGALNAGIDFYLNKGGDPRSQFAELQNAVLQLMRRKEAEDAISYNARRFRHIIENVLDLVMIVDQEGTIEYASPSVSKVLRYKMENLLGRNVKNFIHPEDRFFDSSITRKISRSGPKTSEIRLKTKDGDYKWFEGSVRCSPKEFGEGRFIINAWNIDERKKMELAIIDQERILRAVFDNANENHAIITLDGTIVAANKKLGDIIGCDVEEIIGSSIFQLVAPQDREEAMNRLKKRVAGELDPSAYRITLRDVNGKDIPSTVSSRSVHKQGEETLIILSGAQIKE